MKVSTSQEMTAGWILLRRSLATPRHSCVASCLGVEENPVTSKETLKLANENGKF